MGFFFLEQDQSDQPYSLNVDVFLQKVIIQGFCHVVYVYYVYIQLYHDSIYTRHGFVLLQTAFPSIQ